MIYHYVCTGCGHHFDVVKKLAEIDRVEVCPECVTDITKRIIHAPGFTTSESLGRRKAPDGFRDIIKTIHQSTPGSKINLE